MKEKVYWDTASTTPLDPRVEEAMRPWMTDKFGNPSSPHGRGQEAARALEQAREKTARCLNARAEEIIFTSGATESNNTAMSGVVHTLSQKGRHIVISSIEHPSVLEPAFFLQQQGYEVSFLSVDGVGRVDPNEVEKVLREDTVLLAVMHASNEIGTVQPVEVLGRLSRERGVPFLVDVVQTVGHQKVDVRAIGADYISFSAHKFYGPKGVGGLFIRDGAPFAPLLRGGDQERGRRASTVNVPGAVGLAEALALAHEVMDEENQRLMSFRDRLIQEIPQRVEGVRVNGCLTHRLAHNVHLAFRGIASESLVLALDMEGFCVSMGSACHSGAMEPSHVVKAIGLSNEWSHGALRLSPGRGTTEEEVDRFLEVLPAVVSRLRV